MNDPALPAGGVLVTFALPDESRDFTTLLTGRQTIGRHLPLVSGRLGGRPVVVVHTGVGDETGGRERLRAGWEAAGRIGDGQSPVWVVSAGYAGGLRPDLRVGDLVLGENHSSFSLVFQARTALAEFAPAVAALRTEKTVADTAAAKQALHAGTGAAAVDMETAWIAAECADRAVPLLSLRVISDPADLSLPVPGHVLFDAVCQRPRYLALPLYLLAHPGRIAPLIHFVNGLGPARARLTRALRQLLAPGLRDSAPSPALL